MYIYYCSIEDNKMKIKSIRIENMHNVKDVTYDFSQINYATGPNGSGKSTILQAVELALLGYIPGYPKKNSDIMKHSSNSMMAVTLNFDNGNMIKRVYTRKKSTVSCDVITVPEDLKVEELTEELASITFDFNAFLSKSANEQKKWFISFLSTAALSEDSQFDIDKEVKDSLPATGLDEATINLLNSNVRQYITKRKDQSLLEYIKTLETSVSEGLSYEKGVQQSLQNTLNTLVLYEDVDTDDEEELVAQLQTLRQRHTQLMDVQRAATAYEIAVKQLESWKGLEESLENDSNYVEKAQNIAKLKSSREKEKEELQKHETALETHEKERTRLSEEVLAPLLGEIKFNESLANGSGLCPYSSKMCEEVKVYIEAAKKHAIELEERKVRAVKSITELDEVIKHTKSTINTINRNISQIETSIVSMSSEMSKLKEMYEQRDKARNNVPENPGTTYEEAINSASFVSREIEKLTGELSKIEANKKYESVKSQIDRDMLIADMAVKSLTVLKTRFGQNGLQQDVVMKPFKDMIETISSYLQKTFNTKKISAYFTLSEKSNSFEFGLINDKGIQIPFETLSSGEKCVYMLALQSSLVDKSNGLKVIILDDVFDHVDAGNIKRCVNASRKFKSIQYMFATFNTVDELPSDVNLIEVN